MSVSSRYRSLALTSAIAVVLALPAVASAGPWYYKVSCTGGCAPGQLARVEIRTGFATEASCNAARARDSFHALIEQPGNAGNVDFCRETTSARPYAGGTRAASRTRRRTRLERAEFGLAFGPGWTIATAGGPTHVAESSAGFEIDIHTGRRKIGVEWVFGLHASRLESPVLGEDSKLVLFIPMLVGVTASPFELASGDNWELRPDLGASIGLVAPVRCTDCFGDGSFAGWGFGAQLKVGLDLFTGKNKQTGYSVDVLAPLHRLGDIETDIGPTAVELEAPTWMLRLSWIGRGP